MTRELTSLKNNKAKASKKSKDSEKRCLKDDAIDNCECKRFREKLVSLREEYQQQHGRAYDDYRARTEETIKNDLKTFLDM
jgi:DNA-directed RNA polymerase delta subunit